jgi:glycosyltransferase involved in cell wall biosynthesis
MRFSVIVPAYNAATTLPVLLVSLSVQSFTDFETVLVDDGSRDGTVQIAESYPCRVLRMSTNRGPARCRNEGARVAQGEILAFTDSDCEVAPNWFERMNQRFQESGTDAIMGRLVLKASTFLGDSISALGFPAGGSIGFEKIWRVDQKGFADSLSSCNCAVRKSFFQTIGGFDETFPYAGGEDSLLAYHLKKAGCRIRFCPDVLAYHGARDSLRSFLRWQFRRGKSSYIFSTKVRERRSYMALRMWSTANILRSSFGDRKFPVIVSLLALSFLLQMMGFFYERNER